MENRFVEGEAVITSPVRTGKFGCSGGYQVTQGSMQDGLGRVGSWIRWTFVLIHHGSLCSVLYGIQKPGRCRRMGM